MNGQTRQMPSYLFLSNFHSLWGLFGQQRLHRWLVQQKQWPQSAKGSARWTTQNCHDKSAFSVKWPTLRTNRWCGYGFPPWPSNGQCLHVSSWRNTYARWLDTPLHKRYVDDPLVRMPSAAAAAAVVLFITLYSLHSSLTFTMELLTVNKISFYRHWNCRERN